MASHDRRRLLRLVRGPAASDPERPDALATLARAAGRGDRAAIRTFLVTVGPHLLRVVRRVLGAQHPDVDDVAQDSAFAVMDALPEYLAIRPRRRPACSRPPTVHALPATPRARSKSRSNS
jgi:Sigma-70 region 2